MILEIQKQIESEIRLAINDSLQKSDLEKYFTDYCSCIKDYVFRKGKRLRPILFTLSYKGLTRNNPLKLFSSAAALELLHIFALIQDDIIDNSDYRRGFKSLHVELNGFDKNHDLQGKDIAMVVSDFLYSLAIILFNEIDENLETKAKALKYILDSAITTTAGQLFELLYSQRKIDSFTLDELIAIYDKKTTAYTFSGPLISGAILANANSMIISDLQKLSKLLGRAYQLQDDLFELIENDENAIPLDIIDKRKTVPLWYAYKNGDVKIRSIINSSENGHIDSSSFNVLKQNMIDNGTVSFITKTIESMLQEAFVILDTIDILPSVKISMRSFISSLFKNQYCITILPEIDNF